MLNDNSNFVTNTCSYIKNINILNDYAILILDLGFS